MKVGSHGVDKEPAKYASMCNNRFAHCGVASMSSYTVMFLDVTTQANLARYTVNIIKQI